jgi:AraC-like DNA-binding protein
LLETEAPLGEIARHAGFYDVSHLIRSFTKLNGITPARFRLEAGHHGA